MAVVKLSLDDFFEDDSYTIVAIHCVIEQYRLAYLINSKLEISLKRTKTDVEQTDLCTNYELFKFEDDIKHMAYYMVSNICKSPSKKNNSDKVDLFSEVIPKNDTINYLMPELKKVSHFFKIDAELSDTKTQLIINKILEIPQVITAYKVDISTLKSKNNLIFI